MTDELRARLITLAVMCGGAKEAMEKFSNENLVETLIRQVYFLLKEDSVGNSNADDSLIRALGGR